MCFQPPAGGLPGGAVLAGGVGAGLGLGGAPGVGVGAAAALHDDVITNLGLPGTCVRMLMDAFMRFFICLCQHSLSKWTTLMHGILGAENHLLATFRRLINYYFYCFLVSNFNSFLHFLHHNRLYIFVVIFPFLNYVLISC